MYPNSLRDLIESLKFLPGVGEKTAVRYAFYLLGLPEDKMLFFQESLKSVKTKIKKCKICNHLCEDDVCDICKDTLRNNQVLCVVEDPKTIILFENFGIYHGKYHVLEGLISPSNQYSPEEIGLERLLDRIKQEKYSEVILALKANIDGETTSLYIKKILEGMPVTVTKLASGIPLGADIEYIDDLTLARAIKDRKKIS